MASKVNSSVWNEGIILTLPRELICAVIAAIKSIAEQIFGTDTPGQEIRRNHQRITAIHRANARLDRMDQYE